MLPSHETNSVVGVTRPSTKECSSKTPDQMVVAFSACALVQVRKKKEKKRESFSLYYADLLSTYNMCVYIPAPSSSVFLLFFLPSFLSFPFVHSCIVFKESSSRCGDVDIQRVTLFCDDGDGDDDYAEQC